MRKIASIFMILLVLNGTAAATSGCATWWSNFKSDPVAQTQSILSTIQTIVSVATMVFGQVKPALSPEDQVAAQEAFDKAVLAVQHSEGLIQQAVQTAADQKTKLDLTALLADAGKAVDQLQAMIAALKAKAPGKAGASPIVQAQSDELSQQVGLMHRQMAQ